MLTFQHNEYAKQRKVVVTGGAGFIGSHLVEHLVARTHDVHVIDNLVAGSEYVHQKAHYVVDIRNQDALLPILKVLIRYFICSTSSVPYSIENPVETHG